MSEASFSLIVPIESDLGGVLLDNMFEGLATLLWTRRLTTTSRRWSPRATFQIIVQNDQFRNLPHGLAPLLTISLHGAICIFLTDV
jgi:hypothetical protein